MWFEPRLLAAEPLLLTPKQYWQRWWNDRLSEFHKARVHTLKPECAGYAPHTSLPMYTWAYLRVPVCACVYRERVHAGLCVPVVFKGDGLALVSSVGMLPAQKGFGEGGEGKSFSGSRWEDHPNSILGIVMQMWYRWRDWFSAPDQFCKSQPAQGTFGLSLQLETSGDGRCRGHKEDVFINLFCWIQKMPMNRSFINKIIFTKIYPSDFFRFGNIRMLNICSSSIHL